jgi:hypothetical protein
MLGQILAEAKTRPGAVGNRAGYPAVLFVGIFYV